MSERSQQAAGRVRDVQDSSLYHAESARLRRFFRLRIGRSEDVGDLVQEAFARLAGRRSGDALRNPGAYLQRIARNLLIDRARRVATRPLIVELGGEGCPDLPVAADQGNAMEDRELMAAYEGAVEVLPPRTREVFLLHRVGGLSYQEIAARLAISIRTVEWHIGEALLRIRRALDGR
jgi:RNA polymerase sigma-70 factor (ECF subfamily)